MGGVWPVWERDAAVFLSGAIVTLRLSQGRPGFAAYTIDHGH